MAMRCADQSPGTQPCQASSRASALSGASGAGSGPESGRTIRRLAARAGRRPSRKARDRSRNRGDRARRGRPPDGRPARLAALERGQRALRRGDAGRLEAPGRIDEREGGPAFQQRDDQERVGVRIGAVPRHLEPWHRDPERFAVGVRVHRSAGLAYATHDAGRSPPSLGSPACASEPRRTRAARAPAPFRPAAGVGRADGGTPWRKQHARAGRTVAGAG